MQVLFSAIPESDEQGDEVMQDAEGTCYYYAVKDSDFCEEEFTIQDSCGRWVPFPLEDIDVLINALEVYRVHLVESFFNEPDAIAVLD